MRKELVPMAGGLDYYLPRYLIPRSQWSAGTNVRFGPGYAEKVPGWAKLFTSAVSGAVYHIDCYNTLDDDAFLMIHTPTKLYKYTDGDTSPVDITGTAFSGLAVHPVSSCTVEDLYVFTNQVDRIKFWGSSGNAKILPGSAAGLTRANSTVYEVNDFITVSGKNYICITAGMSGSSTPSYADTGVITDGTVSWEYVGLSGLELGGTSIDSCVCIVQFAGFLVALGTVEDGAEYPSRVRWAQYGNCFRWKNNADGSGQAGWLDLEGADPILSAKQSGSYLVIYKEKSISVMSYIGGDTIYQVTTSRLVTGIVGSQAITNTGPFHLFVGDDNIYSFDLTDPIPVGDAIKTEFFRLLSPGYKGNLRAFFNKQGPEALFAFTSVNSADTNNDMALIYNTDTKAWGIRELPMCSFGTWLSTSAEQWDSDEGTWDEDETTWDDAKDEANAPINVCGDANGYIYTMGGTSKDGADMTFSLTTGLLSLTSDDPDEPTTMKRLKRINLLCSREGDYNLTIEVGTANNIYDDITWGATTYSLLMSSTANPWVDVDITGRYFAIRLSNLLKTQPFRITGMVLFFEKRGDI